MTAPMQPWAPTLTPHQTRRAGKTLEELGELVAVLGRLTIQEIDGIDIGSGKTNRQRLTEEVGDAYAQLGLLVKNFNLDEPAVNDRIHRKVAMMAEWEAHYTEGSK